MNITIKGKIKNVFPEETNGNFKKRVVWVTEQEGQYPQTFEVQFIQQRASEPDGFGIGDNVEITAAVQGKHVAKNGKEYVFNSIVGWGIKRA